MSASHRLLATSSHDFRPDFQLIRERGIYASGDGVASAMRGLGRALTRLLCASWARIGVARLVRPLQAERYRRNPLLRAGGFPFRGPDFALRLAVAEAQRGMRFGVTGRIDVVDSPHSVRQAPSPNSVLRPHRKTLP